MRTEEGREGGQEKRGGRWKEMVCFRSHSFLNLTTIERCSFLVPLAMCVRQASDFFFYELALVTQNSFPTKLLLHKW